jgi:hypothetical protein
MIPEPERGSLNYLWLVQWLEGLPWPGLDALRADMKADPARHISILAKSHQFCTKVEYAGAVFAEGEKRRTPIDDPGLVQTASGLFYVLLMEYEESGAAARTLEALVEAHNECLWGFLTLAYEQVDALCRFLMQIESAVAGLLAPTSKAIVLDFPVGNSLPVKILGRMLRRRCQVLKITVSLARKGAVRKAAIREQLSAKNIRPGDIVVYFDEWNTGVNFAAVCDALACSIPDGGCIG